jgi:hypothetical protein
MGWGWGTTNPMTGGGWTDQDGDCGRGLVPFWGVQRGDPRGVRVGGMPETRCRQICWEIQTESTTFRIGRNSVTDGANHNAGAWCCRGAGD